MPETITKKERKHYLLKLSIQRKPNKLILSMKAHPDIETFFKEHSNNQTFNSDHWLSTESAPSLFYCDIKPTNQAFASFLGNVSATNNVGQMFESNGSTIIPNLGLLRAVNITSGVTLNCSSTITDMIQVEQFARQFITIVKSFYARFISKKQIKAFVTYEL